MALSVSPNLFSLIESHKNTIDDISFANWANGNTKMYICGTLEVNPTMTTPAAEKHGNMKKNIMVID